MPHTPKLKNFLGGFLQLYLVIDMIFIAKAATLGVDPTFPARALLFSAFLGAVLLPPYLTYKIAKNRKRRKRLTIPYKMKTI